MVSGNGNKWQKWPKLRILDLRTLAHILFIEYCKIPSDSYEVLIINAFPSSAWPSIKQLNLSNKNKYDRSH